MPRRTMRGRKSRNKGSQSNVWEKTKNNRCAVPINEEGMDILLEQC